MNSIAYFLTCSAALLPGLVFGGGPGTSDPFVGVAVATGPGGVIWTYAITAAGECWRSSSWGEGSWYVVDNVGPPASGEFCSIAAVNAPDGYIWTYALTDSGECWRSNLSGEGDWYRIATLQPLGPTSFRSISGVTHGGSIWTYALAADGEVWRSHTFGEGDWYLVSTISPTSDAPLDPSRASDLDVAPNPARDEVTIEFSLEQPSEVAIRVFDSNGRLVRDIVQASMPQGPRNVQWDRKDERGASVPAGVYFIRFASRAHVGERQVVLID